MPSNFNVMLPDCIDAVVKPRMGVELESKGIACSNVMMDQYMITPLKEMYTYPPRPTCIGC